MVILFFFSRGDNLHHRVHGMKWGIWLRLPTKKFAPHDIGQNELGHSEEGAIIACTFADRLPNKGL